MMQTGSHNSVRIFQYVKQNGAQKASLQQPKVYSPGEI